MTAASRGPGPQVGGTFGRYRIDHVIGVGGMGTVFAAEDTHLDRKVALKVVLGEYAESPEFLRRFQREAAALARLDSPHVVGIYDHGEHDGWPYIVTQYAGGGDLGRLLRDRGAMPPQLAARLCSQVADALSAAHTVGVVHRDVKPPNVLLRDERLDRLHVYLCDFGVALTETSGMTSAGAVAGTWNYMAPERSRGEHGSPASDLYSLGCLFWECVTGQPPYTGSDVDVAMAHLQAPVPVLPGRDEFTVRANDVIARTMAKDPHDRYRTALELRDDLRLLAGGTSGVTGAVTGASTGRSGRRRALVAAGAAVVVLAGGGVAAVALGGGGDEPGGGGTPAPTAQAYVTGDVNDDDYGDVGWVPTIGSGLLFLSGEGTRIDPSSQALSVSSPATLTADVNGDGVLELVTVAVTLDSATVRLPDATPITSTFPKISEDGSLRMVAGDVDGDGRDDVVVVVSPEGGPTTLAVLNGREDGTFGEASSWYEGDFAPSSMVAIDVDDDGDDDLVATGDAADAAYVLSADQGSFTLGDPQLLGGGLLSSNPITAADVDADGRRELILVDAVTARDVWAWSFEDGEISEPRQLADDVPARAGSLPEVAPSDVDGDGDDDLVLMDSVPDGNARSTSLVVLVSDGETLTHAPDFDLVDALDVGGSLVSGSSVG